MIKRICAVLIVFMGLLSMWGCSKSSQELVDGYYTAEMKDYENGWKEFVTICVSGGKIVDVEYNARNASGYIKSWDMAYMRRMNSKVGMYPNAYTRLYASQLLELQNAEDIDAVTGATHSGENFRKMAGVLLEKAKTGDTSLAIVE